MARSPDDAFETVEAGNEQVLQVQAFQIFQRACFPKVETAGVLVGGNQGEFDAGAQAENDVAGDLENAFAFLENVVLLAATRESGRDDLRI
jgi:hypothetical protein